jgi:branched-chain amino acid transport system permease protein
VSDILQQILNGISLGSTYALLALGLAIVFSIIGLVNFAHGELITVCGYVMFAGLSLGLPWEIYALLGILGTVAAALVMERLAFRPVRNASPLTMMLTSLGVSIMIAAAFETFVSPRVRAVPAPDWISSAVHIGGLRIQAEHILTIGVTAVAVLLLLLLLRKTVIGVAMRAAAEDFNAVRLMGIKANAVIVAAFAISGLLAGLAAVLILARRGAVNPHMGIFLGINAFVANVIGGLGNLWGALAGGFALGFVEVALRAWLPVDLSGFTTGFVFLFVAIALVVRPGGLFTQKSAERV